MFLEDSVKYIMKLSKRLALFNISFLAILVYPLIHINSLFMGISHRKVLGLATTVVNNLFNVVVENLFSVFNLIYTDGSATKVSSGFSIYIPNVHPSMSDIILSFIF